MTHEAHHELPDWYHEARKMAGGRYGSVVYQGCRIAYQAWGEAGSAPLILLHGAGASSEWWEATALSLADRFHIVAPSFAGVGRSQWRERYAVEQSVGEAMACAEAEGVAGPDLQPVYVAHSFGSETGVRLAIDPARPVSHLILVDSLMGLYGAPGSSFAERQRQFYPSVNEAISRFSTVPRDDFGPEFLRAHVARQSLEAVVSPDGESRWSWRADPNVMARLDCEPVFGRIGEAVCPVDLLYGEHSSMNSPDLRTLQAKSVGHDAVFRQIDGAGHHIPLDRPEELALAIRQLVEARE